MSWLITWVQSGNAATLIAGLVAVEMIAIAVWRGRPGFGIILGLVPGLFLVLALRAALLGHGAEWVGLWLTLSLPAHLLDLKLRLGKRDAS